VCLCGCDKQETANKSKLCDIPSLYDGRERVYGGGVL
jgi:hypothetical protein